MIKLTARGLTTVMLRAQRRPRPEDYFYHRNILTTSDCLSDLRTHLSPQSDLRVDDRKLGQDQSKHLQPPFFCSQVIMKYVPVTTVSAL